MTQTPEYRRLVRLAAGFNRNAAKAGAKGHVTADDLVWITDQSPFCHYCLVALEPGQGTFDHVISLKNYGPNTWLNIVRCCITCNRRKFTKSPKELEEHRQLRIACEVCGKQYQPRWAEYVAGRARVCSRSCAARKRWL